MAGNKKQITLVHVTTVPYALFFLKGQAAYLRARGITLHALSSPGSLLDRFAEEESVPVHGVSMLRTISPFKDALALYRIIRIFRTIRPLIVHAHTPKGGLLAMLSAFIAGVPIRIYHIHGLPFITASGALQTILKLSEYFSSRLATRVLCVSNSVQEIVLDERLCDPSKISVPVNGSINGVDASYSLNPARISTPTRQHTRAEFGIPNDAVVVAFVGRIVEDKGIVDLALAWRKLRSRFSQLHLLLAGKVEEKGRPPNDLLAELRSDPRVHFAGHRFDMPHVYAIIDILVLPTYREGFPVVLLEAAAMEIPVVATRVEGCIDAVQDGITGTLVTPRCPAALVEALATYVEEKEMRRRHGANGRSMVLRDYQPRQLWQSYYQVYLEQLERYGMEESTSERRRVY